ncbi:type VI secretion system protein ImpA [Chromobacterium alkanivorans]|uniref:type VI secretion system protein TssA n=1 Tax=Chromobacterium alkanivorans TaxID=1071719 RepID=UPI002166C847|nr:type VI secretion system protein TssA [Chromobacterium alkanivorans]MCS3804607.1 type VI secretion system protein ImpA [Chromobacterium alkanivorans]MCS3818946.1 type VI secretion system protein ImpA [Chromobacterium alkanivorans]MCS3873196.1 type VI secretion system protein ImpA [Chromobacterium alkanivorans]
MSATPSLDTLLQAIAADNPGGEPLRYAPEYDQLRELRREDDPSLPAGIWESDLKRADWAGVERVASALLAERSKDLMVAAWLGESWLHLLGLSGLEAGLALSAQCCEQFWDSLHPLPQQDDQSFRTGPLEWLAKTYAATLAAQVPLLDAPPPQERQPLTLRQWQDLNRRLLAGGDEGKLEREQARHEQQKLHDWVRALPPAVLEDSRGALARSRQWLARLQSWCDERMGADAPSYAPLNQALEQAAQALQELAVLHPGAPAEAEDAAVDRAEAAAAPAEIEAEAGHDAPPSRVAAPAFSQREPQGREDAYRQLRGIADYLARTEPHSPVPYLIYRAVEWGDKPLRELLAELIDSDAEARRLWSLLGVLP